MQLRNALYAQAGGVTAVINASAYGVAKRVFERGAFDRLYAARHGVLGVLKEDLIDLRAADPADIDRLRLTPGGAFGSCRYDLDRIEDNPAQYDRVFEVFAAHDIGCFIYNGGNGSMETALQLHQAALQRGYPLQCIGIPKTVDNDIVLTDCSPGFGSAAKYLATSMREVYFDLEAMRGRKPRIFILEVMGRNTGWLAASTALARMQCDHPPHLILVPEVPFQQASFLAAVECAARTFGYCAITVSEGIRDASGEILSERNHDAFGHVQLGGAGLLIAQLIEQELGYPYHVAVADYLQRAARHMAASIDLQQAQAVGEAAIDFALNGASGVMAAIVRDRGPTYAWHVESVLLGDVANLERTLPSTFFDTANLNVTQEFIDYCAPLIRGEEGLPYDDGLPAYRPWNWQSVPRKLALYQI